MDDTEYLEPGFDPNKLRVVDLRRILVHHGVHFNSLDKKRVLIEHFNHHITSQAAALRQARDQVVESSSQGIEFMPGASPGGKSSNQNVEDVEATPRRRHRRRAKTASRDADEDLRSPSPLRGSSLLSPRSTRRRNLAKRATAPPAEQSGTEVDFSDDDHAHPPRSAGRERMATPKRLLRTSTPSVGRKSSLGIKIEPVAYNQPAKVAKSETNDDDHDATSDDGGQKGKMLDDDDTSDHQGLFSDRSPVVDISPRRESGFFSDENPFQSGPESGTPDPLRSRHRRKSRQRPKAAAPTTALSLELTSPVDSGHDSHHSTHAPSPSYPMMASVHKSQPVRASHVAVPDPRSALSPYAMRSPPVFRKSVQPNPVAFNPSPNTDPAELPTLPAAKPMGSLGSDGGYSDASMGYADPVAVDIPPRPLPPMAPSGSAFQQRRADMEGVPDMAATIPEPPSVHPALRRRFRKSGVGASGRTDDPFSTDLDRDGGCCSSVCLSFWMLLVAIVAGVLVWHRQESFHIGYCDDGVAVAPSILHRNWSRAALTDLSQWRPENFREVWEAVKPSCLPCPHRAHCAERAITRCDDGFMVRPHPLANPVFPFPDHCVPDTIKLAKVEQVTDEIVHVLSERLGQLQCNWRQYHRLSRADDEVALVEASGLSEPHLYAQIYALKDPEVPDAEFQDVWQLAMRNLKQWGDRVEFIVIGTDSTGTDETLFLVSRVAYLPMLCRAKNAAYHLLSHYIREVLGGLIGLAVILFIRARYRRFKRENQIVAKLVHESIERLVQQEHLHCVDPVQNPSNALSVTQLRDVLVISAYASSQAARHRLWERVRKQVEQDSNIRVRMTQVKGEPHRVWEWIGAPPSMNTFAQGTPAASPLEI
ncbi:inner nuclear membrane protein enriched at telomere/subtelomere region [Dimargaris xerosporica]|nr:inner nuclear membrane protein enriched at telomere/subtelomere region [Dimargaris xerosporica]